MNSPDRDPVPLIDEIAALRGQFKEREAKDRQDVALLLDAQVNALEVEHSADARPTDANVTNDVNHALQEASERLASLNLLDQPDE